jgi:transposase-like protein
MKYTIVDFNKDFQDEDACLEDMFTRRYGAVKTCPKCKKYTTFYKVADRKCYACQFCGHQLHPLAGTIFHKSSTPLKLWYFAIFLFSTSKKGVSAKELQRQLGVTYKCAWRMAHQIRKLMGQDGDKLSGIVEADETYIGGYKKGGQGGKGKTPILGLVQRGGGVKAKVAPRETHIILNHMRDNVEKGTTVFTDQFGVYKKAIQLGYTHDAVNHWKKEYARNNVHTNTIEGFWGQLKRSIRGTYTFVSVKHLQAYVDEFAWRYSNRANPLFSALLQLAWKPAR